MKALLFGSIGVFCDSSDLQRQAYNQAFKEADLDWHWDEETYRTLLEIPGGQGRLQRYADEHEPEREIDVAAIHRRKTELYTQMLDNDGVPLRDGVARLIGEAREQGLLVGWVTSTEQANLSAIMDRSGGTLSLTDFDIVKHRDNVSESKPDPAPYLEALAALGVDASEAIAIEDTAACIRAAAAAEIMCIATPHRYSQDQDLGEAVAVVRSLGDHDASAEQLSGVPIVADGMVTAQQLASIALVAESAR